MKHIHLLSVKPQMADDIEPSQKITFVSTMLLAMVPFLEVKEGSSSNLNL